MKLNPAVLVATLLVLLAVSPGQTSRGDLVADIPFPFVVQGEALPAGHYMVKDIGSGHIQIISTNGQSVLVPIHAGQRSKAAGSKLEFRCYEGACFLASIWITGNTIGRELFPSRSERELIRRNAEVTLALVRPAN